MHSWEASLWKCLKILGTIIRRTIVNILGYLLKKERLKYSFGKKKCLNLQMWKCDGNSRQLGSLKTHRCESWNLLQMVILLKTAYRQYSVFCVMYIFYLKYQLVSVNSHTVGWKMSADVKNQLINVCGCDELQYVSMIVEK